jgi:anaerobic selenocysteine-containing dehydrogenase
MDRRSFLCGISAAAGAVPTAATATAATPASPKENAVVNWKVNGFTCITCAVGLEVMLRGLNGVARVKATYPANQVSIGYDQHLTNPKTLRDFITVCGFQVQA